MALKDFSELGLVSLIAPRSLSRASTNSAAVISNAFTGTYTDANGRRWGYVTFTSSSTLTVTVAGYCDALIVGGGQSGVGQDNSGGTHAGGNAQALVNSNLFLSAGTYTITIGAGGAGGASQGQAVGSSSGIDRFSCAGGSDNPYSFSGFGRGSTGGGGAGAASTSAVGGSGISSDITGSATFYGGGGGSGGASQGAGGAGGGGAGGSGTGAGTSGTANTGGGGGGAGTSVGVSSRTRGAGGSGIIVVRVRI